MGLSHLEELVIQINNFILLTTKPDKDGFFPVEAVPLSGKNVSMRLSAGAVKDITDFGNKQKMAAVSATKKQKAADEKKDPK